MKKIIVRSSLGSYRIIIGNGIVEKLGALCKSSGLSSHVVVITDKNVASLYLDNIISVLETYGFSVDFVVLPPGESQKSLKVASRLYTKLLEFKTRRNETVIAFGGGVIGDLAGFVSATYMRGINLVHVPTTLLAQVDSSIGGKVGVNHPLGKNLIGAFYPPVFTFIDVSFLRTLPKRELICGLGEVVKYGIIKNKELFKFIESNLNEILNFDLKKIMFSVFESAKVKSDVVSKDEREKRLRMVLNFGHTVGHGIEAGLNYRVLKHGEAVLLGIVSESYIAFKRNFISQKLFYRIVELSFNVLGERKRLKLPSVDSILKHAGFDKKVRGEKINMYLPIGLGRMKFCDDVSFDEIKTGVEFLFKV